MEGRSVPEGAEFEVFGPSPERAASLASGQALRSMSGTDFRSGFRFFAAGKLEVLLPAADLSVRV